MAERNFVFGSAVQFSDRYHEILREQNQLGNAIFHLHENLFPLARVDYFRPRAREQELNQLGQDIADLQERVRVWVQNASAFRDNPDFEVPDAMTPFAEADFLHEMVKLTSAIEHTRQRMLHLALEHRFVFQLIQQQVAFNVAIASVGLALVFGIWSVISPAAPGEIWRLIGGMLWGMLAGAVAAHYAFRTLY